MQTIEKNVYEIAKFTAIGCICLGCLLAVASGNKGADAPDWIISAFRMWGFGVGFAAIAVFVDGRRQMRDARADEEKAWGNP